MTQLNGIRWQYDVHGRTIEKDNGQVRWRYRYDGEHRLSEVMTEPRDRNKPRLRVSFRYDPLGRRISKTVQRQLHGKPAGRTTSTYFIWDGLRLLQEIHDDVPLTYIYSDVQSYEPLARVDGTENPEIFWFHTAANGMPERLTDSEGRIRWEGFSTPWGKPLSESNQGVPGYDQNLRLQAQYLDRETGLHYNLFRYYDPDSARFTQQDPIGLAGGMNLYAYAPNPLSWIDPLGLAVCSIQKLEEKGFTGVKATKNGGLDYANSNALYAKDGVNPIRKIEYTGNYHKDFEQANMATLGQKSTPKGHVWYHLDDYDSVTNTGTVQLVKQSAHRGIPHIGGVSQYQEATGIKYIFKTW